MKKSRYIAIAAATLFISSTAWAGVLTVPNTFTAGSPAVAAQVNANFSAAKVAVDDNNVRINSVIASASTNTTDIAANTSAITTLQNAALVRTINVSPVIGGGGVIDAVASGNALIAAVGAITGSSVTNQFTVKLEPGTYDLVAQTLTLPDGVNLEGSGRDVTSITTSGLIESAIAPAPSTVDALGNSTLRNIKLEDSSVVNSNGPTTVSLHVNSGLVTVENCIVFGNIPISAGGANIAVKTTVINSRLLLTATAKGFNYPAYSGIVNPSSSADIISSEIGDAGVNMLGLARCASSYYANFTAVPAACK